MDNMNAIVYCGKDPYMTMRLPIELGAKMIYDLQEGEERETLIKSLSTYAPKSSRLRAVMPKTEAKYRFMYSYRDSNGRSVSETMEFEHIEDLASSVIFYYARYYDSLLVLFAYSPSGKVRLEFDITDKSLNIYNNDTDSLVYQIQQVYFSAKKVIMGFLHENRN